MSFCLFIAIMPLSVLQTKEENDFSFKASILANENEMVAQRE